MKTRIILLALALLSLGLGQTLTAQPHKNNIPSQIVGTWAHNDGDDIDYLQFNADGTGFEWEAPRYVTTQFRPLKKPFKYEVQNGRIIFQEADGDIEAESLRIVNKNKIRIDHDTYKRQN